MIDIISRNGHKGLKRASSFTRNLCWGARFSLLRRIPSAAFTDSDFNKVITLNPGDIVHYQDVRYWDHTQVIPYDPGTGLDAKAFILRNVGKVLDGDWDLVRMKFDENDVYRLLFERFVMDVEWGRTEVLRDFEQDIAEGRMRWHKAGSKEQLQRATRKAERLFEQMKRDGYRHHPRTGPLPSIDEVTVSIGRGGELLYCNVSGHHRLSIAKILGVEKIPVRLLVRHREWQDLRNRVKRARRPDELDSASRAHLSHPDLADIVPASWTESVPSRTRSVKQTAV